jgi:hypothetical protein
MLHEKEILENSFATATRAIIIPRRRFFFISRFFVRFFFMFRRNIFLFQAISSASIHAVRDGAETTTWFPSLK